MKSLYTFLIIILLSNSLCFSQSLDSLPIIYVPGIMGSPLYDDINYNNLLTIDEKAWFGPRFTPNLWLANNGIDPSGNYNIKVAPLRNDVSNTLRDELNTVPMNLFKGFFDNMEANGYTLDNYDDNHSEGENLFCFTYDWRKNNLTNAELLSNFIDSVISWTGFDQVNLVGHSMGGIVSKTCINNFDNSRLDKVVFIGTPHLGAPEVLTVMLKGKLFEWINFVNEIEWPVIRSLARNLTSCYQLIPSSSYYDLGFNNGVSSDIDIYTQCFQLPNGSYTNYSELINYLLNYQSCIIEDLNDGLINSSEIFKAGIDTVDFGDVDVFNIVGYNQLTIGKNRVIPGGFPTYCNTIEYSRNLNGDFTIPVRSAELINGQIFEHTYYIPGIPHHEMPGSQETLEILSGIFGDPQITYFPEYADPPPSYKSIIVDVENETEIPISFYLSQNFPNPFNPSTTIKFTISNLPAGKAGFGFTILKVFDVLGNEVATLVNEEKPAGVYELTFFAGNLPSGTYFYQLKTNGFIKTRKMILMK